MPFLVDWHQSAVEELAAIWLRARDPESVMQASAQVDRDLAEKPHNVGSPIGLNLRSHVVVPLAVIYEVINQTRSVTVSEVTEWRPDFN